MFGFRPALPGEVWHISASEAHCFSEALERFCEFFHEELLFWFWLQEMAREVVAYNPALGDAEQKIVAVTPTSQDLVFFGRLIEKERAHLAFYDGAHMLECRHEVRFHEAVLADWHEREIETAEKFASSREAVAQASLDVRLFASGPRLSREDAERIIEDELRSYRFRRKMRDAASLREMEELNPPGYDRDRTIAALNRACEAGVEDARAQLREIMAKYIVE